MFALFILMGSVWWPCGPLSLFIHCAFFEYLRSQ